MQAFDTGRAISASLVTCHKCHLSPWKSALDSKTSSRRMKELDLPTQVLDSLSSLPLSPGDLHSLYPTHSSIDRFPLPASVASWEYEALIAGRVCCLHARQHQRQGVDGRLADPAPTQQQGPDTTMECRPSRSSTCNLLLLLRFVSPRWHLIVSPLCLRRAMSIAVNKLISVRAVLVITSSYSCVSDCCVARQAP